MRTASTDPDTCGETGESEGQGRVEDVTLRRGEDFHSY